MNNVSSFQKAVTPKLTIAAPSFIWPAPVGENCYRLRHLVQEVGLVLFETQACLEYTEQDLPSELSSLELTYHVHLPLDLPWSSGVSQVIEAVRQLVDKTAFLCPRGFVLHPPPQRNQFLAFCKMWQELGLQESQLLIENIEDNDLSSIWSDILATRCQVCLDIGHLLAFSQEALLDYAHLWDKVAMLHIYGDLCGHKHLSLASLSPKGQSLLKYILSSLTKETVIVLEVFDPEALEESLDIFSTWISKWGSG